MIPVRRLRTGDEELVKRCVEIGVRKYPEFDAAAAYSWGCAVLAREDVAIFVTSHCFAVAVTYERFWDPGNPRADVALLCSGREDKRAAGQLMALVRAAEEWAISLDCRRLDISAETGVDLGPLARRLGPARQYAAYMLELPAKGM